MIKNNEGGDIMDNLPTKPSDIKKEFSWERLGINKGRATLGNEMPVLVYRLMQFSMFDVLVNEFEVEKAQELFRKAGYLAGTEYAKNILDLTLSFDVFIPVLQNSLIDLRIGVLNLEEFNARTGEIVLTISEDLGYSGFPVNNETACYYGEGFIAGILDSYTGKKYTVREIDCWTSGDRVYRFHATVEEQKIQLLRY